jgi:hypothetical protein
VVGYFNVPNVYQHSYPQIVGDYLPSSIWAGIDTGQRGSADVAQAGANADCEVYKDSWGQFFTVQYTEAWAEWAPDPPYVLPNFPVWPNDNMYVWVNHEQYDDNGIPSWDGNNMNFGVYDLTSHTQVFGCIGTNSGCKAPKPAGVTPDGATAEWIIERPEFQVLPNPPFFKDFPDYSTAMIYGAWAATVSSGVYHTVVTDTTDYFYLQDSGTGHTLSTATTTGSTTTAGQINFSRTQTNPMHFK